MDSAFDLPGYRRRICIEPGRDAVRALLEDDIHCMAVTLRHDGHRVTAVAAETIRVPWTTCPGARAMLAQTFTGCALADVTARRDKRANCTHLHDLAVLAAAHAHDMAAIVYDVAVSDPVAGERVIVLERAGAQLLRWVEQDGVLVAPASLAGLTLPTLRDWIASLALPEQEPARLLQWAAMVAHGRTIPMAEQSRAAAMPASCYTVQPERAVLAVRDGEIRDFSRSNDQPLDAWA